MSYPLTDRESAIIQKILVEELGVKPEQLVPDAALVEDLGADSLTKVEIVMRMEQDLGVTISDEAAERVQTVEDVYETAARVLRPG